jgi:hypothetical protein
MRIRGIAVLVIALVWAGAARGVLVRVESDPAGYDAWAGDRYMGRTPAETRLPAGRVRVRLAVPSESLYVAPVADTIVSVPDAESLTVRIRAARTVTVRSQPFDLPLRRDGMQIGRTPLDFPLDERRPGRIDLLTPSGPVAVPTDTLLARGSWSWIGGTRAPGSATGERSSALRRLGRYVLPGLAAGLATSGILVKDAADRSYDRYRKTADPGEIRRLYDESRRRDTIAAILWTGAEACILTSVIAWILPDRSPPRPGEDRR